MNDINSRIVRGWKASLMAVLATTAGAQTNLYLRAGGPAPQIVTGATNATPIVIATQAAHGFSSSCNTTTNICYCGLEGVTTGTGASPANGVRECQYVDSTHLALYDMAGNAVAGTGAWWNGASPYPGGVQTAQWIAPLTKFVIPANPGPLGFLDGSNGDLMRRLSLSTVNGITSSNGVVVSGCSAGSGCVVTVNVTYNPTTFGKFPIAPGQHFSVTGTGTAIDTCGDGTMAAGPQSPYTVASTNNSSWTSTPFTCAGLTNGDKTNVNTACGPASTPNDTIGGSQSCTRVSQIATTANPTWNNLLSTMVASHLTSAATYKTTFDGGLVPPGDGIHTLYSLAAIRFLVDPTNSLWLNEILYSLNYDFRTAGTGYTVNNNAWVFEPDGGYNYSSDMGALAVSYEVATHAPEGQYWTASEKAAFLNRMYNDIDDPSVAACNAGNQDAANPSNHNWVLSSGLLATGSNDSTHAQLPNTDPHYSTADYYKNTVIALNNSNQSADYSHNTYGVITAQSNTGVLTIGGGWQGTAPALNNIVSATYTSGLTATGTSGQYVCLDFGGNSYGLLPLNGANAIASGTSILITGPYWFATPPTSASVNPNCSTASASGTAAISTTLGTQYTIFDTITISSVSAGAPATVTFTKTSNPAINVGDGLMGFNGWGNNFNVGYYQSYVSGSPSGSTVPVINGVQVTASTSTPQMAWRLPQWTSGDCGRLWATKHQSTNAMGAPPILYGYAGGIAIQRVNGTTLIPDVGVNGGGNSPPAWMIFELVTASDDPRAVRDLVRTNSFLFDYAIRPLIDFSTGRLRDGPGYSNDEDRPAVEEFLWALAQTVPNYPSLAATGPWAQNLSIWQMFETLPQTQGGNAWKAGWGGAGGYGLFNVCATCTVVQGTALDPAAWFAPSSNNAAWLRNWAEHVNPSGSFWGWNLGPNMGLTLLHNDPRIADSDYTIQPLQYAFDVSSSSQVTALTGWPPMARGDAVISRTCWQCTSGTLAIFDSATYTGAGAVYDSPRVGNISIWKGGAALLCSDSSVCNSMWAIDPTALSDTFQFNGSGSGFYFGLQGSIGYTPLTAWASANAGTYGAQYGDAQSRYAAACTSELPNYNQASLNITLDHAVRCFVHMKKNGDDEWIFQFDDVALASGSPTSSLPMAWHLQYPENGQTQSGFGGYTTGTTTYLGSNVIKEVEDGNNGRNYGLMTYVASPLPITLNDDCAGLGGGQCAPGNTYSGGLGYTHRFTVAGGASVGAHVSKFVSVAGHKLMSSLTDTTFTTVNLNPDANWSGVQLTGAKSTAIALFAVGGPHSFITSFTTNFSGTADWTIMGLTPGAYSLTVGGMPVSGSPFTVGAGDGSIYFSSGPGAVVLTQGATTFSPTSLLGQITIAGNSVIH